MRWEPYNKEPELLCGVPEESDPQKGYRIVQVHDFAQSADPVKDKCRADQDGYEHIQFIKRIATGLNLLNKIEATRCFAIDTNLGLLRKRIEDSQAISGRSNRLSEALAIIDEIQASVEKIKAAIKGMTT